MLHIKITGIYKNKYINIRENERDRKNHRKREKIALITHGTTEVVTH